MIGTSLRIALASLLVSPTLLQAQPRPGRAPEEPNVLQVENVALPAGGGETGARLEVFFRIPRRFFVFVRPEPVTQAAPFVARAEIASELFDQSGRSAARDFTTREITSESPQAGDEASETGQSSFRVPPGEYTLDIEVRDRESNRIARRRIPVTVPPLLDSSFASGILICERGASGNAGLRPLNRGGDVPLGAPVDAWFLLSPGDTLASCTLLYRLFRSPSETLDSALVAADSLAGHPAAPARDLVRTQGDTEPGFTETGAALEGICRIRFPLAIDTLEPADYTLSVTVLGGTGEWHAVKAFSIRWFAMPLSLRYFESAMDPMEYLLGPDEFRRLRRSSASEQRAYFNAFWKARDNTPGTAVNEVQAEYYRRVDYARKTFNTLKTENGARSERGKAYILYGPPERIERTLLASSAPQEVWSYPALDRKLTFVDRGKTGDYTLVATERQ